MNSSDESKNTQEFLDLWRKVQHVKEVNRGPSGIVCSILLRRNMEPFAKLIEDVKTIAFDFAITSTSFEK